MKNPAQSICEYVGIHIRVTLEAIELMDQSIDRLMINQTKKEKNEEFKMCKAPVLKKNL